MSILSFPRIYFNGFMQWDVCTANNNDYVPVYAMSESGLNWDYLSQFGVTPENFELTFRPWVINPSDDVVLNSSPSDYCPSCQNGNVNTHLSSRWNYYGSGGVSTVQYADQVTNVIGGVLLSGSPSSLTDPIVGKPVSITGSNGTSSGRLVDIDPSAPWVSQLLLENIHAGDPLGDSTGFYIDGPVTTRMFSRAFFVPRNFDGSLIIAGAIGVLFQTTIAAESLTIQNPRGGSELLTELQSSLSGAAGLMIRFSAYNTLYYQNGVFNGTTQQPRGCCDLWNMYKAGEVFSNPAYSRITGTVGMWNPGELSTAPSGHLLIPNALLTEVPTTKSSSVPASQVTGAAGHVTTSNATSDAASGPPLMWGVAFAEIDLDNKLISLDLSNTILGKSIGSAPFTTGENYNVGPISVGVANGTDFLAISTLPYENGYDDATYNSCSGIYDLPFIAGVTKEQVKKAMAASDSTLQLQVGAPSNTIACQESYWTADTDQRGIYLNEGQAAQIDVQMRYRGQVPPAGTNILLTQYYSWPPQVGSGMMVLGGTPPPASTPYPPPPASPQSTAPPLNLLFVDGEVIPVDENGNAVVNVYPLNPGFPIVVLYPYGPGDPQPTPAPVIGFGGTYPNYTVSFAPYTVCRVLPFDNALYFQFADCWNATGAYTGQPQYDRMQAWTFIYDKILYLYDMLYPVMDRFMPLHNLDEIEAKIGMLMSMTSSAMLDSTLYMPVTRELSLGKRIVLEVWGNLVKNKYPQEPLPLDLFLLPPPQLPPS